MALEPTEEQLVQLAGALVDSGGDADHAVPDAMTLWPLIRDMVLEEAAKALESRGNDIEGNSMMGGYQARVCRDDATIVRELKGKP